MILQSLHLLADCSDSDVQLFGRGAKLSCRETTSKARSEFKGGKRRCIVKTLKIFYRSIIENMTRSFAAAGLAFRMCCMGQIHIETSSTIQF